MMYPPMMPQRVGGRGRGPRMGPYDMAYPPPPGAMMMGRGPMDGFRPRFQGTALMMAVPLCSLVLLRIILHTIVAVDLLCCDST